eukprot:2786647-Lingulodinium_polyedra.AAC.1
MARACRALGRCLVVACVLLRRWFRAVLLGRCLGAAWVLLECCSGAAAACLVLLDWCCLLGLLA